MAGVLHSPGFGAEVAAFLAAERPQVRAIGLDTASLDIGASSDYPAHVAWLPGGRFGIENLANLEKLPPKGAMLFVGAPALQGGSGGPARILALLSSSVVSCQLSGAEGSGRAGRRPIPELLTTDN